MKPLKTKLLWYGILLSILFVLSLSAAIILTDRTVHGDIVAALSATAGGFVGLFIFDNIKMLKNQFKWWPGTWAVPLVLITVIASPYILRQLDPSAAIFDLGYLQTFIYASLGLVIANELSFLGLKKNFPELFKIYKQWQNHFFIDSKGIYFLLGLYVFYVLMFVMLILAFA